MIDGAVQVVTVGTSSVEFCETGVLLASDVTVGVDSSKGVKVLVCWIAGVALCGTCRAASFVVPVVQPVQYQGFLFQFEVDFFLSVHFL